MRIVESIVLVVSLWVHVSVFAENWPQWRGPHADGVAASGDYPIHFSETENVQWKVKLAGPGSSTPAVWNDNIFVTGQAEGRNGVICFSRSGGERWRVMLDSISKGRHRAGTSANSSPVTDGEFVFVYFKSGTVAALDFSGNIIWQDNLQERYGKSTLWWDLGTSPVLTRENLVIAVMHEGDSYLVAFDRATGKVAWREPRQFECARESDQAYTTPVVLSESGRERIIVWGADHLSSHDARNGKMIWECDGFNPLKKPKWRVIASAAVGDGIAVVTFGRAKSLAGIDIGENTAEERRWLWNRNDIGFDVPTPPVKDGRVYILKENGRIACINTLTGEDTWSARLPAGSGTFYASPILAGGRIYYTSFKGVVFVGRVDDGFELLAENEMNEPVTATPVPVDGKLLIRGFEHLFCIGPRSDQ